MESTKSVNQSIRYTKIVMGMLFCTMFISGLGTNLIVPSLPHMADSLHVSHLAIKNAISLYLFGYAIGSFIMGFLTDSLGRKQLFRISALCFVVASFLPVIYHDISIVLVSRLLQGIFMGAATVVARAIFSDILSAEKMIKIGVLLGSILGFGIVFSPVIGGYLQVYFSWIACFVFFVVIMLLILVTALFILPETHFNTHHLNMNIIYKHLLEVVRHKKFMAMSILMGVVYSLNVVFNTMAPFLIQSVLGYSTVFFSHIAFYLGVMFLLATFVGRLLLKNYETKVLFSRFIVFFVLLAFIFMLLSYFFDKSIFLISIASAVMFFASGIIYPMAMGKGISLFPHMAGTATAIMYLINIFIASVVAFLMSLISVVSAVSMMWIYLILLSIALGVYFFIGHKGE